MRRSKADAEQTRMAILDAAERLFFDRGIATTTLERIARAAGVTRGAVYWHFKDKGDVLNALRHRYCQPKEELNARAADHEIDDPLRLLEDSGCAFITMFETTESQQHLFGILAAHPLPEEIAATVTQANSEMFQIILRLMVLARSRDVLVRDVPPEEAALTLMVIMNGLLSEWLHSGKAFPLSKVGPNIFRRQVAMLRRPLA